MHPPASASPAQVALNHFVGSEGLSPGSHRTCSSLACRNWSLRDHLPPALMPVNCRQLAVRQWQAGWEAQASHGHIATATGGDPYPAPAAGAPRWMVLDAGRVPARTRQGSQGSATDYGSCRIPKSTICPPASLQSP